MCCRNAKVKAEQVLEILEIVRKQVKESGVTNNFFKATEAAIRQKSLTKDEYKGLL